MADRITSKRLVLRLLTEHNFEPVVAMLSVPGLTPWWPRFDAPRIRTELFTPQKDVLVWGIETAGELIGAVTVHEENDPDYPSAGIDIFIGEAWWGRGFGTETINVVCDYLATKRGHHRITIDPAVTNTRAISCYKSAGFRTIGAMHSYERGPMGCSATACSWSA